MRKKFGAGVSDHQIALARQEELRARLGPNDAAELQRIAKEIARLRELLKQPDAESHGRS
jgi:hypothetical protein